MGQAQSMDAFPGENPLRTTIPHVSSYRPSLPNQYLQLSPKIRRADVEIKNPLNALKMTFEIVIGGLPRH